MFSPAFSNAFLLQTLGLIFNASYQTFVSQENRLILIEGDDSRIVRVSAEESRTVFIPKVRRFT